MRMCTMPLQRWIEQRYIRKVSNLALAAGYTERSLFWLSTIVQSIPNNATKMSNSLNQDCPPAIHGQEISYQ